MPLSGMVQKQPAAEATEQAGLGPFHRAPTGDVGGRQFIETAGGQGSIGLATDAHYQQGGHGKGLPEAGRPRGVGDVGLLPLPTAAFGVLETAFDPGAQAVPTDIRLLRGQVGNDEPG